MRWRRLPLTPRRTARTVVAVVAVDVAVVAVKIPRTAHPRTSRAIVTTHRPALTMILSPVARTPPTVVVAAVVVVAKTSQRRRHQGARAEVASVGG